MIDVPALVLKSSKDQLTVAAVALTILVSTFLCVFISWILGVVALGSFLGGSILAVLLLNRRDQVAVFCSKLRKYFIVDDQTPACVVLCEVCGEAKCPRHKAEPMREPWRNLLVDADLDQAVDSFFSHILSTFIESWFNNLSSDREFVRSIRQNLREALSRVIVKLQQIDAAELLTEKLLPCAFAHFELVRQMVENGVPMDRLAKHLISSERAIHPALLNRAAELNYLRALAKCMLPRLFNKEHFTSPVFFSLVRELFSNWTLLPLMDVISDPNLINLLVVVATNKPAKPLRPLSSEPRVVFLERFVTTDAAQAKSHATSTAKGTNILTDQNELYAFMQFLKKEGAVDVLRFYLDVDGLNADLLDPKVTTDPTKLSALHQQSVRLLESYQKLSAARLKLGERVVQTLAEAHEEVRQELQGKWQSLFHRTPEYFKLVYGSKDIKEVEEVKDHEHQTGFRFGSKLKGALRSAVDGSPLEGTEVPTFWEDSIDEDCPLSGAAATVSHHNPTKNTSVTQKLRKERGQHLEQFFFNFMHSIEQVPELGEDVAASDAVKGVKMRRKTPPGRNLVFGDLFEVKRATVQPTIVEASQWPCCVQGPSKCLVFLLVKILNAPALLVRLLVALVNISRSTVDHLIRIAINKFVRFVFYEPRLTMLITTLEHHLFGAKPPDPTPAELLDRQRQAKLRLDSIRPGLSSVVDVLQSPPMNKQLMYSLMDIVLVEVFPELEPPNHSVAKLD